MMNSHGIKMDKRKAPFGLRFKSDELKDWLESKANDEGRSLNNLINRLLEQAMKEDLEKISK